MSTIVLVVHLIIAVAMVGVILLQKSEGGGLGMGGGGMSGFMTGRSTANLARTAPRARSSSKRSRRRRAPQRRNRQRRRPPCRQDQARRWRNNRARVAARGMARRAVRNKFVAPHKTQSIAATAEIRHAIDAAPAGNAF